jgi:hypothetical protein
MWHMCSLPKNKPSNQHRAEMLHRVCSNVAAPALPIPDKHWESVSMDFHGMRARGHGVLIILRPPHVYKGNLCTQGDWGGRETLLSPQVALITQDCAHIWIEATPPLCGHHEQKPLTRTHSTMTSSDHLLLCAAAEAHCLCQPPSLAHQQLPLQRAPHVW